MSSGATTSVAGEEGLRKCWEGLGGYGSGYGYSIKSKLKEKHARIKLVSNQGLK